MILSPSFGLRPDMTFSFDAILKDGGIRCTLTSAQKLLDPVFCFSLMAPGSVSAGGLMIRRVGGFHEVQLPALAAGRIFLSTRS